MEIKNIAIVGAGVMGSDVALDLACFNYNIILKDKSNDLLDKSKEKISNDFKMLKMVKKEVRNLKIEDILSKITFTTASSSIKNVEIVIENVNEEWDVKEKVYKELQEFCNEATLFAVNTSCISITKISKYVKNPKNVIGVHFMNPVPLKKMVEVIRGFHTSKETEENILNFLKSIDKNPVVVNDYPGFVANRLSHLFMNEAAFLVQDQVAKPKEIDLIFKQGYGHSMGPLETADLIGLDTVVNSLDILYKDYQDSKFRCCPLLRKMVNAGLYGRKTGQGFYKY